MIQAKTATEPVGSAVWPLPADLVRPDRKGLAAYQLVRAPRASRWIARWLFVFILLCVPALIFVPWQQSVQGYGKVTAWDPAERKQSLEAPIDGRVIRWNKQEGDRIKGPVYSIDPITGEKKLEKKGEILVVLQDPDPFFTEHLKDQRDAASNRKKAAQDRVDSFTKQIANLKLSKTNALKAAKNRLQMAKEREVAALQAIEAAKLNVDLAKANYEIEENLVKKGLTANLSFLQAKQRLENSKVEKIRADVSHNAAKSEVSALGDDMSKIENDAEAAISSASASMQTAMAEVAQAERDLSEIQIREARQAQQEVTAPCDGILYRVLANANAGGHFVKQAEPLGIIIPDIANPADRMVELYIDGNDCPLITELMSKMRRENLGTEIEMPRIPVRLQFEGWPALQWVGWPSAALGTFGGLVVMVDAHDDDTGKFRIFVKPDPEEAERNPWPPVFSLRQGSRVTGWVLLNRVTLGWELWRQLNGFPPMVDAAKSMDPKASAGKSEEPKPKLPKLPK